MKAALIDPSLFTWPYDRELMLGLRQNGVEPLIFGKALAAREAPGAQPGLVEHFYPSLVAGPMAAMPGPVRRGFKGVSHAMSLARLLPTLRRLRPDVIHFQWAPLPVVDRLFLPALRRIAPLVLTVHDSTPFNGNPGARIQRIGAVSILRDFAALIVHTEQARRRLVAYGLPADKLTLIPHGLLHDGGPAMDRLMPVEELPDQQVRFLMFGKIKPYKGVDTMIRALALLPPEQRARCRVHVVGKPYMDMAPLRALAEQSGVADRIEYDLRLVPDEELPGLFNDAAVLLMPYREIDASGVLMMALVAGRPIIASNIGNFAETLETERNALLVHADDAASLARAMGRVIVDRALRHGLAAGVRDLRRRIPSWTEIGRSTTALYRQLAAA